MQCDVHSMQFHKHPRKCLIFLFYYFCLCFFSVYFVTFSVCFTPPPPVYVLLSVCRIFILLSYLICSLKCLTLKGGLQAPHTKAPHTNTTRIHINALRASSRSNMYYCSGSMSLKKNCQSSIY